MKTILKTLSILSIFFVLVNCDKTVDWQESDAALTPIYSITDIQNNSLPAEIINVYQEKPLIIEYFSDIEVREFDASNFSDTSTDTTINFSVTKYLNGDQETTYTVSADKASGIGTLTVFDGLYTDIYNVTITETEVYN